MLAVRYLKLRDGNFLHKKNVIQKFILLFGECCFSWHTLHSASYICMYMLVQRFMKSHKVMFVGSGLWGVMKGDLLGKGRFYCIQEGDM